MLDLHHSLPPHTLPRFRLACGFLHGTGRVPREQNKWVAVVNYQGREADIGSFDHEKDAALA